MFVFVRPNSMRVSLHLSHINNASNTVSLFHHFECTVDLVQCLPMRDELVHLQFAGHVVVNQVGKLGAALDPAEGASFPYTAGDELERFVMLVSIGTRSRRRGNDLRLVEIS